MLFNLRWYVLLIFVFFLPFSSAIVNLSIGILIVLWSVEKIIYRDISFLKYFRIPLISFSIILFFAFFSFVNTVDIYASIQGISKLLKWMFLFFIVADTVRDSTQLKSLIAVWVISAFFISVDGLYQYATGFDLFRHNAIQYFNPGIFRIRATYSHTTLLAGYLDPILAILMMIGLFYLKGLAKYLFLVISSIIALCFILTWTRIAVVAVALGFMCVWILRKNFILPLLLGLLMFIGYFFLPSKIITWVHEQKNLVQVLFNDDRIWNIQAGMNMIKAHPFIGVGVNTFSKQYKHYKVPEDLFDTGYSANSTIHMGAEIGLFAAAALWLFLFWIFYRGLKACYSIQDPLTKILFWGIFGSLLIYIFHGFMDNNLYFSKLAPLMGFLTGLLGAHVHFIQKNIFR